MRKSCFLLLFVLVFACSIPKTYFVNSYDGDSGVNRWIQQSVLGYVGRYHEYPRSGMDLIQYYEEGLKSYSEYGNDYEKGAFWPSVSFQKKVFLSEKCYYDSSACVIPYKNEQYVLTKSLSGWQDGFYKWIGLYYKPAFFNLEGEYLFKTSEDLEDSFQEEMSVFCQQNGTQIRIKTYDNYFQRELDVPLRVRVLYHPGEKITMTDPEVAYYLDKCLIEESLRLFESFFRKYSEKHKEIYSIDCLIPILVP